MDTSGPTENDAIDSGRLARLERLLEQVSGRLAALEQAGASARPAGVSTPAAFPPSSAVPASPGSLPSASAVAPSSPWADHPAALGGQVGTEATFSYAGGGQFGGIRLMVKKNRGLADILNAQPELLAKVFAGLASPARILLLRALLDGALTSQQLRRELDDASAGQLYHHLKELQAVGLVIQRGRSLYSLPQGSQVALCYAIIAALDLTASWPGYPAAGGVPPEQQSAEEAAPPGEAETSS